MTTGAQGEGLRQTANLNGSPASNPNTADIMIGRPNSNEFRPSGIPYLMSPTGEVLLTSDAVAELGRVMMGGEVACIPMLAGLAPRLAREQQMESEPARFLDGKLIMDYAGGEILVDGKAIKISPTTYKLAVILTKNPDRVFTGQRLRSELWGKGPIHRNLLYAYTSLLRKAVGEDVAKHFVTVPGQGFKFKSILTEDEKIN